MKAIRGEEDLNEVYPGRIVSLAHSTKEIKFTVIDTRAIHTEDGILPNPVTLVGIDDSSRAYTIVVSVWALVC